MHSLRLENRSPLPREGHLPEVDELKGWAMLLVLIYHIGGVLDWPNRLHGEVGVDVFLIVSGFTLARNSRHVPASEFLRRRLLRIYPSYWCALALFVGLSIHYFGVHRSWTNLGLHIVGLHGFADPWFFSDINDSFWFISLILALYLVFLLLRKKLDDVLSVFGAGMLLTGLACIVYADTQHFGGLGHLAVRIPSFFIGVAAAEFLCAREIKLIVGPRFVAGALVLAYLGNVRGIIPFYAFSGAAAVAVLLVLRQSLKKHPDGRFCLSALALLGVYSYEIFLFHQPIIRDYNRIFWSRVYGVEPNQIQLAVGVAGGLVITFGLSFVVHHLVRRLFSRKKNSPRASAA